MKKFILLFFIFQSTMIFGQFKFNYLQLDIGQNFGRAWTEISESQKDLRKYGLPPNWT